MGVGVEIIRIKAVLSSTGLELELSLAIIYHIILDTIGYWWKLSIMLFVRYYQRSAVMDNIRLQFILTKGSDKDIYLNLECYKVRKFLGLYIWQLGSCASEMLMRHWCSIYISVLYLTMDILIFSLSFDILQGSGH